jgi:hypothetical protein
MSDVPLCTVGSLPRMRGAEEGEGVEGSHGFPPPLNLEEISRLDSLCAEGLASISKVV